MRHHLLILLFTLFFTSCFDEGFKSQTLHDGTINEAYSYQFMIHLEDGETYEIYHTDGFIPEGLDINERGLLAGTPLESGEFEFEVTLYTYDSANCGNKNDLVDAIIDMIDDCVDVNQYSAWYHLIILDEDVETIIEEEQENANL